MSNFFYGILIFAQDGAAAPPAEAPAAGNPFSQLLPFLLIGLLFYFILLRPERRKQKDHVNLLGQLKKNDRVVTIGGIYGTVYNVQKDADRVTLKIDEATNTKIDVTFSAVARVILDEPAGDKDKDKSK